MTAIFTVFMIVIKYILIKISFILKKKNINIKIINSYKRLMYIKMYFRQKKTYVSSILKTDGYKQDGKITLPPPHTHTQADRQTN